MKTHVTEETLEADRRTEERPHAKQAVSGPEVKKILVAVDFSEGARRALNLGLALAKGFSAEIVLLHVFEGVPAELKILEASFVDSSFRSEAEANLARWQRELDSEGVMVKALFRESGAVAPEIVRNAAEMNADLIVLGKAGRRGLEKLFVPDTVKGVMGDASCPVLVAN